VSAAAVVVAEGGGGAGAADTDTVTVTAAGADALPASSIGSEWRRRPSRDRGGGGRSSCHPEQRLRQGRGASDRCREEWRWPCPSYLFLSLQSLSLFFQDAVSATCTRTLRSDASYNSPFLCRTDGVLLKPWFHFKIHRQLKYVGRKQNLAWSCVCIFVHWKRQRFVVD
jgi:hypothetical protein